ncbi:MAG TPA: hypothetical protein VLT13_05310, partial [Bacteroidota bacterium]|nr:hypothetical protein [Bacteroidota bacterium]
VAVIQGWSQDTDTPAQGSSFSQAKFVPDISLILDCSYLHRNISDLENAALFRPGFPESGEHDDMREGFNLNYAEITFFSVVDPYFELFAICHLSVEHVHLEEAYWLTKRLPAGFQLKAGKFLSSFGRINELHTHYWDFADRPLVHQALFGAEGLNEIGARITWVAPIETYVMAGGEVLMGDNETSFGRAGFAQPAQGISVSSPRGPALFVGYLESSVDIDNASVLARLSGAHGKAQSDEEFSSGSPNSQALSGNSTILGGALTVKHTFDAIRYLSLQSEYLWRNTKGTRYSLDATQQAHESTLESRQSGFYAQAVTKFGLRWRAGLRMDVLQGNEVVEDGNRSDLPTALPRYSAMLEFSPTEFSRIRLQYNVDRSRYNEVNQGLNRTTVHELTLQVNLAIGAHGAHAF